MTSRRGFLQRFGAAAAATGFASCRWNAGSAHDSRVIGLQLWTLGEAPRRDLVRTLAEVAAIGYRCVELPGHYDRPPRELRAALDGAGLRCPSVHVSLQAAPGRWSLEGDVARLADEASLIGAEYIVVPVPWRSGESVKRAFDALTASDWAHTSDLLNEKGDVLRRHGLRVAYHNHAFDFLKLPSGQSGFDVIVERTQPALVDLELDVGWIASAGEDPAALIEALGARVRLLHLKDVRASSPRAMEMQPADLGTGIVDWKSILAAIPRAGVKHLFVEQEAPFAHSPRASARVAHEFLRRALASPEKRGVVADG